MRSHSFSGGACGIETVLSSAVRTRARDSLKAVVRAECIAIPDVRSSAEARGSSMRRRGIHLGCSEARRWRGRSWRGRNRSGGMRRIGLFMAAAADDVQGPIHALGVFQRELQNGSAWSDMHNCDRAISFLRRCTRSAIREGSSLAFAARLHPFADHGHYAALLQQTRIIPIVFALVADPVGGGFVASFIRDPAGMSPVLPFSEPTMGGKWLELFNEIAPDVTRVLVPFNSATLLRIALFRVFISAP